MQTANFEVMPDGYIHLYNHLNDVYTVSKTLTDSGLSSSIYLKTGTVLRAASQRSSEVSRMLNMIQAEMLN